MCSGPESPALGVAGGGGGAVSPAWGLKMHTVGGGAGGQCWLVTATEATGGKGAFLWDGEVIEGAEWNVFMMTSLFLLLVNQLRGSSRHLFHWLEAKDMSTLGVC